MTYVSLRLNIRVLTRMLEQIGHETPNHAEHTELERSIIAVIGAAGLRPHYVVRNIVASMTRPQLALVAGDHLQSALDVIDVLATLDEISIVAGAELRKLLVQILRLIEEFVGTLLTGWPPRASSGHRRRRCKCGGINGTR